MSFRAHRFLDQLCGSFLKMAYNLWEMPSDQGLSISRGWPSLGNPEQELNLSLVFQRPNTESMVSLIFACRLTDPISFPRVSSIWSLQTSINIGHDSLFVIIVNGSSWSLSRVLHSISKKWISFHFFDLRCIDIFQQFWLTVQTGKRISQPGREKWRIGQLNWLNIEILDIRLSRWPYIREYSAAVRTLHLMVIFCVQNLQYDRWLWEFCHLGVLMTYRPPYPCSTRPKIWQIAFRINISQSPILLYFILWGKIVSHSRSNRYATSVSRISLQPPIRWSDTPTSATSNCRILR
jgi:hypothetical protein